MSLIDPCQNCWLKNDSQTKEVPLSFDSVLGDVLKKDIQTLFDAIYDLSDIPLEELGRLKSDTLSKLTLILRLKKIAEKHFA